MRCRDSESHAQRTINLAHLQQCVRKNPSSSCSFPSSLCPLASFSARSRRITGLLLVNCVCATTRHSPCLLQMGSLGFQCCSGRVAQEDHPRTLFAAIVATLPIQHTEAPWHATATVVPSSRDRMTGPSECSLLDPLKASIEWHRWEKDSKSSKHPTR